MRRLGGAMRWLVPRTIMGQIVLLLVVALVAANAMALLILGAEQARFARDLRRGALLDRLAGLSAVLAEVPPNLRQGIADTSSTPVLRLAMAARPSLRVTGRSRASRRLAARLRAALEEAGRPAPVRVEARGRIGRRGEGRGGERRSGERRPRRLRSAGEAGEWEDREGAAHTDGRGPPPHAEPPHWARDRHAILASIPFDDGTWLNAVLPLPDGRPRMESRAVLLALALSLITVLAVGITFTRRLTRPIRSLADAAERAGFGDRGAVAAVAGPAEVRRAAEAFNAMQKRIADFDAERARTIAAVGHDLRTPITSLRIRAEMLDDATRDAMVRTLDEMRVMADGLLAYGRSEAEPEDWGAVDIAALLAAQDEGIGYEGPASLTIEGRPVALSRAISNLSENARRYAGGGVWRLSERATDIDLILQDNGPGIPPERLTDMFEPFVRLDASRNAETGGAGLGLSIARTIVRAHGGDIALANRPQSGLEVRVRLPRKRPGRARRTAG